MNLWLGLIVALVIGFVWSTIICRKSANSYSTNMLNNAVLCLPNNEEFESDGSDVRVRNETSLEHLHLGSSEHGIVSEPVLGLQNENRFEFDPADAISRASCEPDDATLNEHIREESTYDKSLIAADGESSLSEEDAEDEKAYVIRPADKFREFENVGKTLRSLIKSISEPPNLEHKEGDDHLEECIGITTAPSKLRCFINVERCMYDLVLQTAKKLGMRKSSRFWDLMWFDVEAGTRSKKTFAEKCSKMNDFQIISHFPGFWSLSSKDLFVRNLQRMQKYFPHDFGVFPKSWILPRDGLELSTYARNHKRAFFIAKPNYGCAGNGIFLTRDVRLDGSQKMVYQLYIKPFLIDGYKFDFRVYVLVTSCDPLRIYVYNEGLARFATVKYENPTRENSGDVFMHLTNTCVNTRNSMFVKDEFSGHSRRMTGIFKWFRDNLIDPVKIQNSMDDAIIKTMIAVLPTLRHNYKIYFPLDFHSDKCFEILGFDIMLDHELNVHVLEVNPSPSFGSITHTSFEAELKESVLRDTFKVLEGNIICKMRKRRSLVASKCEKLRKTEIEESIQALSEWESSHLGNFRKAYPPEPSLEKYYQKFIAKAISLQYNLT